MKRIIQSLSITLKTLLYIFILFYSVFPLYAETGFGISEQVTLDTNDPQVTVLAPNGGEILYIGDTFEITWNASDFSFPEYPITIFFSSNNGQTYTEIAGEEANDSSYLWGIPSIYSEEALIKITALDTFGNSGEDISDDVFTLTSILDTVAIPIFNPPAGVYTEPHYVKILCSTSDATIHYTLDLTDPDENSPEYTDSILVDVSMTIKAKAYKQDWLPSQIATAIYNITGTVATPTFDPPGGTYTEPQYVKISCLTSESIIRFTLDGTDPDENSLEYTDSILVDVSMTIKAKAYKQDWLPSQIATAIYIIEEYEPDVFIAPDSLAFGNVTVGAVSSIKSFYIFNQGNVDLDIFEISTPEAFEIKKGDAGVWVTNILDFIILDNSFQKIYVRFIPTDTGSYSGDISIYSNDPDEDTVYVNVSGTGVEYAVPNIEINPTEIQFGSVTILTSKEEFFTISNTGSAELIIDSIYVHDNSGFMIRIGDSGEYSNFISGFTIFQGNEQIIYVEFIPHVVGYYSAYISISSNAGDGNDFVFVFGTGVEYDVPDIDVHPVELHFGAVPIYQSVEDIITIMNTGNTILEINDIYSLSGYEIKKDNESWGSHIPAFDILQAEEEIIYVKFHPEALITYNGFIYITSNDPDESSIPVLVEGQGIPVLSEIIPDAFTPNGDGLNDEFIIGPFQESGNDEVRFKVYDLRGKLIYETKGPSNEALNWDGNDDSGNKSSSGAYIYVYLINNAVYKSGKIYLVR
ncbi:MAG: choice-of-anchor D domain-containing protein [Candidatus Cloacimonetes bacterium]|nr:choice-of-anchor D domain-containing protein [Candidatus Cloacimonadota bacterium]